MLKKIIISIFLLFICNTYSMANPVPVFCLFGWLDDVSNEWSNACGKINNYIYEADYATDKNLKTYRLLGPYIYEADYATDKNLKTYRLH